MEHAPHNRVALVTGAGTGIGRATSHALISDGWRVVFAGRRSDALRDAVAACPDPFGDIAERAFVVVADVTQPDSVDGAVRTRCASASGGSTCCSTTRA